MKSFYGLFFSDFSLQLALFDERHCGARGATTRLKPYAGVFASSLPGDDTSSCLLSNDYLAVSSVLAQRYALNDIDMREG